MNQTLEIKKEINSLLQNMQLPKEIKTIVNSVYKEYEKACRKLISRIRQKDTIDSNEIQKIEAYIQNDYKEDMQMTELVEFEEYEQKRAKIMEIINKILQNINDKERVRLAKLTEKMDDKVLNERDNKRTANIIVNTTVSEIESSAKNIITRINKLNIESQELEQIKIDFKEEIDLIIEDAKQNISEISEILNNHYQGIYSQLDMIIEKYTNGINDEEKQTHTEDNRREEFKKRIASYKEVKRIEVNNVKNRDMVEELEK